MSTAGEKNNNDSVFFDPSRKAQSSTESQDDNGPRELAFLELLSRLQSSRIDDQRAAMPTLLMKQETTSSDQYTVNNQNARKVVIEPIKQVLASGAPYPMVVLPVDGEYWMEGTNHVLTRDTRDRPMFPTIDLSKCQLTEDAAAHEYRRHFLGKEHINYVGVDNNLGPMLLSVKFEDLSRVGGSLLTCNQYRVVLRLKDRSIVKCIKDSAVCENPGPRDFIRVALEEVAEVDRFHPVAVPRASEDVVKFDEHALTSSFKVGIVYQKYGQTTEDEYFQNQEHTRAFEEFLGTIGDKVALKDFPNYRGGLDVKFGQTGDYSYYTEYKNKEIMFHVSTLLPFTPNDQQQLRRKRHIGNDVVAIIFQEKNTPFCPSTIRSHFLHVFIIVQVEHSRSGQTYYKVSVTSKEGVPKFMPDMPNPCVFKKGTDFREFLLTKILNGEKAAFKTEKFSQMAERTRTMLLQSLVSDFIGKNEKILDDESLIAPPPEMKGGIFSSFRSALNNRTNRSGSTTLSSSHSTNEKENARKKLGHLSLSLNDLTSLTVDEMKKETKKLKKKTKKDSKSSTLTGYYIHHQTGSPMLSRAISPPGSPTVHRDTSLEMECTLRQTKTKQFSNNVFELNSASPPRTTGLRARPVSYHESSSPSILRAKEWHYDSNHYQMALQESSPDRTMNGSSRDLSSSSSPESCLSSLGLAELEIERLKCEMDKLKIDKMELIRQNNNQQREISDMKDRLAGASNTGQAAFASQNSLRMYKRNLPVTPTEYV